MDRDRILKSRTSHPVFRITEIIKNFKPVGLMKFYNNLEYMFKREIPSLKICLVLTQEKGTAQWNFFKEGVFVKKIKDGDFQEKNVIKLRCNGDVIDVEERYINDSTEATLLSGLLKNVPIFFIDGRMVFICGNKKFIDLIQDIVDEERIGVLTKKCLPAQEYRKLIENHHEDEVKGERGIPYWKDKKKRILREGPEIIFHKSLYSYLNKFALKAKVDSGVDIGGTTDRTDIRILCWDPVQEIYIIEIKCLGRCKEKDSEKSDNWANQGILQLRAYLDQEDSSKIGLLVIYDGRKNNKEINWIPRENWHEKTDSNPMRFYLISEPASVRAKKELKKIKVEMNEKGL